MSDRLRRLIRMGFSELFAGGVRGGAKSYEARTRKVYDSDHVLVDIGTTHGA